MNGTRPKIFIIGLTLLIFSLSTSGQSATYYRCVNSQGSVLLTDNPPTDPDFKCTFSAYQRDLTPQERAKEQREMEAYRQQLRAANAKHDAEKRAEAAREETERSAVIAKQEAARSAERVSEQTAKSKEKMEKTDRLEKELFDFTKRRSPEERDRLAKDYQKAASEDPRAINTTLTIRTSGGGSRP